MNNFYGNQLPPEHLRRQMAAEQQRRQGAQRQGAALSNPPGPAGQMGMENPMMMAGAGQSLDDIILDNSHELHRRRSAPRPFDGPLGQGGAERRTSMLEFGGSGEVLRDFHFGSMAGASGPMAGFGSMGSGMGIPGTAGPFSQPMLAMSEAHDFPAMSTDIMSNMSAFSNLNVGQLASGGGSSVDMFSLSGMPNQFGGAGMEPMPADFPMDLGTESGPLSAPGTGHPPVAMGMDETEDEMVPVPPFGGPAGLPGGLPAQQPQSQQQPLGLGIGGLQPSAPSLSREVSSGTSYNSPASPTSQSQVSGAQQSLPAETPVTMPSSSTNAPTPVDMKPEKNVYSKSGFDMVRALYYVATRQNPQVNLGAVDMSCAFVVCDVTQNDCPIIYVSDNFQNLTGYSRHEIVGQNCRFLQAPDGRVEAGSKREFVENDAVYNIKKKITEGREVQQSLINYRKGGKPFLNLLTMIPIPWETKDIKYFIGFQIDLVECPDAITGQEMGGVQVNYMHSDIGQYIWTPPPSSQWEPENGQTLGIDDVSTLLQQLNPKGAASDWHKQTWDKMLLENTDDVVHVLSLKGLFLYLSPSCKRVLEYDTTELVGNSLSSVCHPSDIVPVTRELKDTAAGSVVSIVFRIRRKASGYTWFESRGSLFVEQGKGRKCIILVGRKRPVFALSRRELEANGGIGDSELWTKISTSGMFLFVSSNVRSLLDLQPEKLQGTNIQELMRKESRAEFGRSIEKARRGKIVTCKHEVHNRRGQVLQALTVLYPGDAAEGQKPTFLLAQTKLLKASSRASGAGGSKSGASTTGPGDDTGALVPARHAPGLDPGPPTQQLAGGVLVFGTQDAALAADINIFDELKTTRCTSWQYELRQMEKVNRILAEELGQLLSSRKKRKRRKGVGNVVRDCANCHTRNTPEWRRGPSGQRDLCNSCGLRWAKQIGRVSSRTSSRGGNGDGSSKKSNSPVHNSPLQREVTEGESSAFDVRPSRSSSGASIGSTSAGGSVPPATTSASHHAMPPPSQPLLDGGSGFRGTGMEMTSIREE